ncbi:MAG: CoA transferase [Deltaproteobacteria bacterium]|nr:MAG: CoA transferase [Deltaproteobacteria bacterium]
MSLPLEGIVVLDFSEYIAGPYSGALLSDLGAEVIKVEPLDGAEERRIGNKERYQGDTRMALTVNRGKRSICVNLQEEEGRKIVYRLVEKADITIQNYAPGVAEKLGIDYETLSRINPRLIFISSTAFGDIGPYRQRKGFDIIAHAASGIMFYYADEEGNPRGPGGPTYNDIGTGMLNALGAVTALMMREKTGEGQKIETSLFHTGMAFQTQKVVYIDKLDRKQLEEEFEILRTAHQQGKRHTNIIDEFAELALRYDQPDTTRPIEVPDCYHRPPDRQTAPYYRIYETANGYMGIAAVNRKHREGVGRILGIKDEGVDRDIGNVPDDIYYHQKEVMREIESQLKKKTTEEWIKIFEDEGVPCGQVNYSSNFYDDPQAVAVNMIWELENRAMGKYKMAGHPVRYLKIPVKPQKGAPTLGEHTDEILTQFGYTNEEIAKFRKSQVVR